MRLEIGARGKDFPDCKPNRVRHGPYDLKRQASGLRSGQPDMFGKQGSNTVGLFEGTTDQKTGQDRVRHAGNLIARRVSLASKTGSPRAAASSAVARRG